MAGKVGRMRQKAYFLLSFCCGRRDKMEVKIGRFGGFER